MTIGALGKIYEDGDCVIKQGEPGDAMYVVQQGKLDVLINENGKEVKVNQLAEGDVFGEMALFTKELRSASVRANGEVRVLTVDKRGFFRRVLEDPSLAFNILKQMSIRIRKLSDENAILKAVKE